jgi:hypothetical protein
MGLLSQPSPNTVRLPTLLLFLPHLYLRNSPPDGTYTPKACVGLPLKLGSPRTVSGLELLTMPTDFILPLVSAVLIGFGVYWITKPRHDHFPPGPKRYPIIGNLFNFPRDHFYDAFTRWQKEYGTPNHNLYIPPIAKYAHAGDVVYANFFGQPIYVINTREKAEELLTKRGNVYSGRPQQILPRYL